jgi:hypothetical protein
MSQYILRDLPPDMWMRFKRRAELQQWPIRALILRLLEDYADNRITPSAASPRSSNPMPPPISADKLVTVNVRSPAQQLQLKAWHAIEDAGELVLLDANRHVIGRFPRENIESWRQQP